MQREDELLQDDMQTDPTEMDATPQDANEVPAAIDQPTFGERIPTEEAVDSENIDLTQEIDSTDSSEDRAVY